jgi:hypothetical protein
VPARDFADANPPTPGGELWHGQPPGHRGARLCGTDDTEAVMKFLPVHGYVLDRYSELDGVVTAAAP